jgi:hypothetical protein
MYAVLAIGLGLLLVAGVVRTIEKSLIYLPPRYPLGFEPPEEYGLHLEEVWIRAVDGVRLNAFYFSKPSSRKVLLWFHGNAENIGYGLEQMKAFTELGVSILEVDYRGYGKSEGKPDEAGLYRDAEAAYRYLLDARRFPPEEVIFFGQSLGGAVAVDLASRHPCGGLILQSTFTSARDMARRMFAIPLFAYVIKSRFDSLGKMARVRAPVLIVHGTNDEIVPFVMGQQLYALAPEPKSLLAVEGAGHNDLREVGGQRYLDSLKRFVSGKAKQ